MFQHSSAQPAPRGGRGENYERAHGSSRARKREKTAAAKDGRQEQAVGRGERGGRARAPAVLRDQRNGQGGWNLRRGLFLSRDRF